MNTVRNLKTNDETGTDDGVIELSVLEEMEKLGLDPTSKEDVDWYWETFLAGDVLK